VTSLLAARPCVLRVSVPVRVSGSYFGVGVAGLPSMSANSTVRSYASSSISPVAFVVFSFAISLFLNEPSSASVV